MTIKLRQSTATTILIGPIVDLTTGAVRTAETIAQTDVLLWKQGGTGLAAKNESTACTHRSNGLYTCLLDATDTNTLGQLTVNVNKSGTVVFSKDFMIQNANSWDSFCASDRLQVDVLELNSTSASASKLEAAASTMTTGTVDTAGFSATTTEFETSTITEATADHFKGKVVSFRSGAMAGQSSVITAYALVGGRGHLTVAALTESPPNGTTFIIS